MNEKKSEKGANRRHIAEEIDREKSRKDGGDDTSNDSGNVGGLEPRVYVCEEIGEETILSHGVKDAGLAKIKDKYDGGEAGESAEGDDNEKPCLTRGGRGDGDGSGGEAEGDNEGADDADRKIARRIFGLEGCGSDGIETDVGEEDLLRAGEYASDAKIVPIAVGVGRDEGLPVLGVDPFRGAKDENHDDDEFDDDDRVIYKCSLTNANN
ncbi:hypothetical protein BC937DRAFT_86714 [Endogone sp. FLAS-F59071]|nr:hypothetical protein BC937DRAFT_86714 [Endogone sp. FLAS-F59071]|eukprot:RUS19920.1 hypothetical protein BC937DRAFT_86714 [Endogone sp. FLAS-F59071]